MKEFSKLFRLILQKKFHFLTRYFLDHFSWHFQNWLVVSVFTETNLIFLSYQFGSRVLQHNSIDISSCILILSIRTEFSSSLTRHYYRIFWHNLFYRWFTRHFRICDRFIFIFHRFLNRFSDNVTLVFRIEVLSWKKVDQVI